MARPISGAPGCHTESEGQRDELFMPISKETIDLMRNLVSLSFVEKFQRAYPSSRFGPNLSVRLIASTEIVGDGQSLRGDGDE